MTSATTGRRLPLRTGAGDGNARGFTLIEMMVVVLVIGMMMAIALPQLMPSILLSTFEGAARHLAGYGRAAVSQAVLVGETLVVHIDLERQEYWAERLVTGDDEDGDEDAEFDEEAVKAAEKPKPRRTSDAFGSRRNKDRKQGEYLNLMNPLQMEGEYNDPSQDPLHQRFEKMVRHQLTAQAQRLEKEGILSDIGPLFDKPFALEETGAEERYEEVLDPVLERTIVPEGVRIESVKVGSASYSGGEAHVDLSATGLSEPVVIYLKSEETGGYYTVLWDPITGGAQIAQGKKEFDAAPKRTALDTRSSGGGDRKTGSQRRNRDGRGGATRVDKQGGIINATPRRVR